MPRGRPVRSAPSVLAASLLVVLGLASACDDAPVVAPEDQLLRLGTVTSSLCPSLTTDPPSGTTTIIATVFAEDGQVAVGVPVTFTASPVGAYENATVATDANGQARASLTTPRPDNPTNEITLTATIDNGLTAEKKLLVPFTPLLGISASSTAPVVGNNFTMDVNVALACNIRKLRGGISWDNSKVRLRGSCVDPDDRPWVEYDILNDFDGTTQSGATPSCTDPADPNGSDRQSLTFEYERTSSFSDTGLIFGTSASGSYIGFRFSAVAEGDAAFRLDYLEAFPAGYGDSTGPVYTPDDDGTANIAKVTVRAATSPAPATFGLRGRP